MDECLMYMPLKHIKIAGKEAGGRQDAKRKSLQILQKKISAGASRVTPPDPPTRHGVYLLSRAK